MPSIQSKVTRHVMMLKNVTHNLKKNLSLETNQK